QQADLSSIAQIDEIFAPIDAADEPGLGVVVGFGARLAHEDGEAPSIGRNRDRVDVPNAREIVDGDVARRSGLAGRGDDENRPRARLRVGGGAERRQGEGQRRQGGALQDANHGLHQRCVISNEMTRPSGLAFSVSKPAFPYGVLVSPASVGGSSSVTLMALRRSVRPSSAPDWNR